MLIHGENLFKKPTTKSLCLWTHFFLQGWKKVYCTYIVLYCIVCTIPHFILPVRNNLNRDHDDCIFDWQRKVKKFLRAIGEIVYIFFFLIQLKTQYDLVKRCLLFQIFPFPWWIILSPKVFYCFSLCDTLSFDDNFFWRRKFLFVGFLSVYYY